MISSGPDASESSLTGRLRAITAELLELERSVISGNLDSRVLSEFRNAVDHIRNTAWTVQQWVDAREKSGDPYAVLLLWPPNVSVAPLNLRMICASTFRAWK